jgi:hypothetical protein
MTVEISRPGTSGTNKKGLRHYEAFSAIFMHLFIDYDILGPIPLLSDDELPEDLSDLDSIAEEEKCCTCHDWQPQELRNCTSVVFVKWGKCDFCDHWTHLTFCTPVRVLRRGDVFRCPHYENNELNE